MNVTFDKTGNVTGTITIAISQDDYQAEVTKSLRRFGQQRPIQGFRPGKVPMTLLQKLFGKQATYEVVNDKVSESLTNYIYDNKLAVLGEPMMNESSKANFEEDSNFTFVFDVALAPEFDVNLPAVEIPYYNIEVSEKMVEDQVAAQRKRYGAQVSGEEINDEAMFKGDFVELNEDGTEKEDGIKAENAMLSMRYDLQTEDARSLFLGKHVGDEIVFNPAEANNHNATMLSHMLSISKEEAEGLNSSFRFTVRDILVVKPAELNQEHFDMVYGKDAVKSEEEYYAKVKENISAQLVGDSNYRFTVDAQKNIMAAVGDIEMPDELLKRFFLAKDEKKTAEDMDKEYPTFRPDLQWQLVKDKIAAAADVKVEENDMLNLAKFVAAQQFAQYGMNNVPDDALENYAKQILENKEQRRNIHQRAVDDKIFAYIRENAKVENKTLPVDEFNKLFEE